MARMSKTIGLQGMLQHPARNQVCLVLPNAWIHCGDLILELSSPRRVEFHVSPPGCLSYVAGMVLIKTEELGNPFPSPYVYTSYF